MIPQCLTFSFLVSIIIPKPTAIMSKAYFVTLNATICAVMVVPILAPIITPIACSRFIRPAVTKPTTITVVTDDDCTTAVTPAPVSTPLKRLPVSFSKIIFILSPATAFSESVINSIPYRNSAKPPNKVIAILNQSIDFSPEPAKAGSSINIPKAKPINSSNRYCLFVF